MMDAISGFLGQGGPVVYLLVLISLASWTLILWKSISLLGATSGSALRASAFEVAETGDFKAAAEQFRAGKSPADDICAQASELCAEGLETEVIEARLQWRASAHQARMLSQIRTLELIAAVSPLLGLLGTVLGMIQSFRDLAIAEGAANASLLAGGIWQALLTTAAGLIVAIPALIAATLLSQKVERATTNIEQSVGQLLSLGSRS